MPYIFTYKDGRRRIKTKWIDHKDTKVIRQVLKDKLFPAPGIGLKPLVKTETARHTDEQPLYKVDKDTLEQVKTPTLLQKQITKLLIKKSKIDKVLATFRNDEKQTGLMYKISDVDYRLHTNYNQTVTATGRLSSSDPNSQNLPRGNTSPIKECIVPRFDGIMNADISQIELRVPAQLSGDKIMIKEFQDGEDLHTNTRKDIMHITQSKEHRVWAKIFNFRMIYGGTEYGFFKDPKMPAWSLARWGRVIKKYFKKYAGISNWQENNIKSVIRNAGILAIPTGRTYKFRLGKFGKYNEREIKNYPVQGIAGADILPLAAVIIWKTMKKRKMQSLPILTVHDSIVFDYVNSEKQELAQLCFDVFNNLPKYIKQYWGINWVVPITGEIETGDNYGSQKSFLA
jgi:DNA polymerase-1